MNKQEAIKVLDSMKVKIDIPKAIISQHQKNEAIDMAIDALQDDWIPVSERLPKCEQEVLICTETKFIGKNAYVDSIITPAIYEDGTMLEIDSKWAWELEDSCAEWDEKEDCYIVPEGWWENRRFYYDDISAPVDQKVIAWMPLPDPYKGGDTE